MLSAVQNNDIELIKTLLGNKATRMNTSHALRTASKHGYTEMVKLLIENNADIHDKNDSSLSLASINGHLEIVKILIQNNADVLAKNNYALRWASRNGHAEIVRLLIENNADIYSHDNYALRYASGNNNCEVVKLLLFYNADKTTVHYGYVSEEIVDILDNFNPIAKAKRAL
jgi:ankyrin repeat protein